MTVLKDGETRVMRRACWGHSDIEVKAFRLDSDTPYVVLNINGNSMHLTDAEAIEFVARINRALSILPSSK